MVINDYIITLKYYCMLIYTLTMAHLGILTWILGCHGDKFVFSSTFRTCDKLKYEVRSRKLTKNASRIYTVCMNGVRNK